MLLTFQPSEWSVTMARRRSAASGSHGRVEAAEHPYEGGILRRIRSTVRPCGLCPKRTWQMVAISLFRIGAYSVLRSRTSLRTSGSSVAPVRARPAPSRTGSSSLLLEA
jgi:hypothetical protein